MSPSCRTPGIRSLSRLIERRKVDLPHPDGPMMAVTDLRSMLKFRFRSTWRGAVGEAEVAHVDRRRAPLPRRGAGGRGASVARGVGTKPGWVRGAAMVVIRTSR